MVSQLRDITLEGGIKLQNNKLSDFKKLGIVFKRQEWSIK
jgi:hypothetical protein